MKKHLFFLISTLLILLIALSLLIKGSVVVNENEYALVVFHQNTKVLTTGYHFAWPLLTKATYFSKNSQESIIKTAFKTKNQESGTCSYLVKWKIIDPLLFAKHASRLNEELEKTLLSAQQSNNLTLNDIDISQKALPLLIKKRAADGIKIDSISLLSADFSELTKKSLIEMMSRHLTLLENNMRVDFAKKIERITFSDENTPRLLIENAQGQADKLQAKNDEKIIALQRHAYKKSPSFYHFYFKLKMYKNLLSLGKPAIVLTPDSALVKLLSTGDER